MQEINLIRAVVVFSILAAAPVVARAQKMLPDINDVRNGLLKPIKIPSTRNFQSFRRDYEKHQDILSTRSEKAYRKAFLKFTDIEDELLYTLCEKNEFRANMLMKTASASFGKLEADRYRKSDEYQFPESNSAKRLKRLNQISAAISENEGFERPECEAETTPRPEHGSKLYGDYMEKRLRVYRTTFSSGTIKQRKLLKRLERKARLWQSFKDEDEKLNLAFEKKNESIAGYGKRLPQDASQLRAGRKRYEGTHIDPEVDVSDFSSVSSFKDKLAGIAGEMGLLEDIPGTELDKSSLSDLMKLVLDKKQMTDSLMNRQTESEATQPDDHSLTAVPLKERLYYGFDVRWLRADTYFPEGVGIVLTAGYRLNKNSGLAVEFGSALNGTELGLGEDDRFSGNLLIHYTLGANVDYKIWKWIYAGIGVEGIHNRLEAPAAQIFESNRWSRNALGVPAFLRILLPAGKANSTAIELRYDLNGKNNIKPTFDLRLGYLIGRR